MLQLHQGRTGELKQAFPFLYNQGNVKDKAAFVSDVENIVHLHNMRIRRVGAERLRSRYMQYILTQNVLGDLAKSCDGKSPESDFRHVMREAEVLSVHLFRKATKLNGYLPTHYAGPSAGGMKDISGMHKQEEEEEEDSDDDSDNSSNSYDSEDAEEDEEEGE